MNPEHHNEPIPELVPAKIEAADSDRESESVSDEPGPELSAVVPDAGDRRRLSKRNDRSQSLLTIAALVLFAAAIVLLVVSIARHDSSGSEPIRNPSSNITSNITPNIAHPSNEELS
jgi:hypothetical protein